MSSLSQGAGRLALGCGLIAAVSALLLYSDWKQRRPATGGIPRLALMQYSSTQITEDAMKGIAEALRENGYVEGRNIRIDRFNAENDMPTANAIAREIVSGKYGYAITVTTNCLQAVANANRAGRVKHVFGVVADPVAAKVGIDPHDPLRHPLNTVGIGTLAPIGELLDMAQRANPRLKRVGLPWNPSQTNSEVYTVIARALCKKMGLELLEGSVENTSAVGEVAGALVSRGAGMILMTGDQTVALGLDALMEAARRGRIPVFSTMPATVSRGVLLAAGADYHEIGRLTALLGVRVLRGEAMSRMPIEYITPRRFSVNRQALNGLKDHWQIPDDVLKQAAKVL